MTEAFSDLVEHFFSTGRYFLSNAVTREYRNLLLHFFLVG
jgi:hypothetical protein